MTRRGSALRRPCLYAAVLAVAAIASRVEAVAPVAGAPVAAITRTVPAAAVAMVVDARAALAAGRTEQAIGLFERARDVAPHDVPVLLALVEGYAARVAEVSPFGKMSLAKKIRTTLETAVALEPRNTDALEGLFRFHLEAPAIAGGSSAEAARLQKEIAAVDPVAGRRAAAAALAHRGQLDAAAAELRAGLALRPADRGARMDLVLNAQARKAWDEAFEQSERLAAEGDRRALYQVGGTGALSGLRLDRAEAALRAYLAAPTPPKEPLGPREPPRDAALFRLGQVLAYTPSRREEARAAFAEAARLNPGNDGAKHALRQLR